MPDIVGGILADDLSLRSDNGLVYAVLSDSLRYQHILGNLCAQIYIIDKLDNGHRCVLTPIHLRQEGERQNRRHEQQDDTDEQLASEKLEHFLHSPCFVGFWAQEKPACSETGWLMTQYLIFLALVLE